MRSFCFLLVYLFSYFGYSQIQEKTPETEYKQIITSAIEYDCKVERINQLLKTNFATQDVLKLSKLYNEFGKFNYKSKDYQKAISNTQKALEIQKKFIDSVPSIVNKSYNNLALFYLFSGDENKALQTFKQLIKQKHIDKYVISTYTKRLPDLYIDRGDYFKVIDYLKEAENSILKAQDSVLNKELYKVYLGLSRVYSLTSKKDHYQKALAYSAKVENAISHLPKKTRLNTEIIIYARYGFIYEELKKYNLAIENYTKALTLGLRSEPIHTANIATSYDVLGYIYFKINKQDLAFQNYQKALQFDPQKTSTYDNLGDYYLNKKNYKDALKNYQKAISYSLEKYQNDDIKILPSIESLKQSNHKVDLVNDLKDKAKAWFKFYQETKNKGYLENALKTITLADQLIDNIRFESTEQQSKYFWRKKGVDLYILATSICYELNAVNEAFYFMEKSKSLSLLENLTHEEAKNRAILPDTIREKEYYLKYQIYDVTERLREDNTYSQSEKQDLIFKQKQKYEAFINSLENDYPSYFNYKKEIDIISLAQSRSKIITPEKSLIQYILAENEGYGIWVADKETYFFKINNVSQLNTEIRKIGKLIRDPMTTQLQINTYTQIATSIFKKLLQDKKLLVIPDYTLHYLPFESLVNNTFSEKTTIPYLIYSTEINYAYSISLLNKIEQKQRLPKSNLIGFAPTHFKKQKLASLNRSPFKMKEIKKLFNGNILNHDQATKTSFALKANDYSIIHLSTHANAVSDEEPWIAFHDDILPLNELYFIKNQADLVVLDACKTAIGELQPGEGIMSLSRGFFHSGAKSVVSSLWSTNEKSTSNIILNFYKYLKKGETKSAALRKAKLDYLDSAQLSESSPHFWSPLILTGSIDNTTFNTYKNQNYFTILLITISISILLFLGYKYKIK